ncbi:MAG: hypothetical protein JSU77_07500 [Fidelibacterota bacterium]|nr:MAG: hypothetical protein JSU77_07500 [Candidatus Neomarinimicrobiota bacterium]
MYNPLACVIAFQDNPNTMARNINTRTMGGGEGAKVEALSFTGVSKASLELDP